jgi:hypothetical protein
MTFGELMMGEAFAIYGDHFIKTNRVPEGYDKEKGGAKLSIWKGISATHQYRQRWK